MSIKEGGVLLFIHVSCGLKTVIPLCYSRPGDYAIKVPDCAAGVLNRNLIPREKAVPTSGRGAGQPKS
jgi:hypothetical protein